MITKKPFVWQMIKEAVENLNGVASYKEIKTYILSKWGEINSQTLTDQMQVLSVNHKSRINYPQNQKPRFTDSNSDYDLLFTTGRGEVSKYDIEEHGIWEIFLNSSKKFEIRKHKNPIVSKIFTPSDIVWIKNVTNTESGEAYLNFDGNEFVLNFPTKHRTNLSSPKIGDLILLYQKVKGIPVFSHLVSPIDIDEVDENVRADYRYGRRVKIVAKTNHISLIEVSTTLLGRLNFAGFTQGNACKLENIKNIQNIDSLKFDIWKKFEPYFISAEQESVINTSNAINESEDLGSDISAIEGGLRLVSHIVKERNRKIVFEKKAQAILSNTLHCEVCEFSFSKIYESNFIECHHLLPIGQIGSRVTKLQDLALVCSNCHRMLHTKLDNEFLTIQQLRDRIARISNKY
ncbi:MAG: hypothetical protein CFE23_09310 [Flavobacterium sp. BFFFF1]|uniref:DUF7669 domain-containing protein n=1 Tax=Flavobacterium sp. BFFFF1 TaxID=2015557 RepID=UPI000BD995D4|nr:HNH endonuclease [Flavobacterium sp. BFFFF1]OYU80444.1 MAG: hypothetical protein CFE23_09310 [Flavobacterium sp. BFFFF1]